MFGDRLRKLLVKKELPHAEFARRVPMPAVQLYLILDGHAFPSDKRLSKMIEVLEATAEEADELQKLIALGRAKR